MPGLHIAAIPYPNLKSALGFRLHDPATQRALYMLTVLCLGGAYLLCRWITRSRLGKVLVAIRDSEQRVLFTGYSPADYKLFVFAVSAGLAGLAGALYAPQVGIITPSQIGVLPSIEMVVWVAAGGRGTLIGAVLGAIGVNWARSMLTTQYPDLWPFFLGGLFVGVVLLLPDGCIGLIQRVGQYAPLESWGGCQAGGTGFRLESTRGALSGGGP